jgi:hypothetical protein
MAIEPVLVMSWPRAMFMKVALGIDSSDGYARKKPPVEGETAVTEASTAEASAGMPQPPARPPWAAKADPVPPTW